MLISASLIPIPTLASSLDDCKKAVNSAQKVIDKQDQLINVMKDRNQDLFKERTDLEQALQDSQAARDTAVEHEVLWGTIGVVVGILAGGFIVSKIK
jgi:cell division protein FtsB